MGELSILDSSGDTKVTWNCNIPEEINSAKNKFNELKEKGYTLFEIFSNGDQGKELKEFNPLTESILAIPPTRKG